MKILYLSHRVPYPPNKGDKIRSFHEILHFSRQHEVDLLSFCDNSDELAYAEDLSRYCHSVTLIPVHHGQQLALALIALFRRKPWTLGYFSRSEMRTAVSERLQAFHYDAIFVYSSSMAPYVASNRQIPKLLDFVDSDASKWFQYAQIKSPFTRWVYAYEAKKLACFEQEMARSFDASTFVSTREAEHLIDPECRKKIHYIQNGIDLDFFAGVRVDGRSNNVIFTGVMDYFPNVDAVTFFAHDVFPLVRSACSEAQFLIVGRHPTSVVRRLGNLPGVIVTGSVPDVRPYLAKSKVAIAPMRISQGIQNKILEAIAAGLPVVTTPAAVAGFDSIDDMPITVANNAKSLASHIIRFLQEPLTTAQTAVCRKHLKQHYDWDTNFSAFDHLFQAIREIHSPSI